MAAPRWLHRLADSLARHNDIEFTRQGLRYNVAIPDTLVVAVELEIELKW